MVKSRLEFLPLNHGVPEIEIWCVNDEARNSGMEVLPFGPEIHLEILKVRDRIAGSVVFLMNYSIVVVSNWFLTVNILIYIYFKLWTFNVKYAVFQLLDIYFNMQRNTPINMCITFILGLLHDACLFAIKHLSGGVLICSLHSWPWNVSFCSFVISSPESNVNCLTVSACLGISFLAQDLLLTLVRWYDIRLK